MDKLDTFKALLPFIPLRYRRPLLLFIHIEELMRIINSLNECMRMPLNVPESGSPDMSKLLDLLKQNTSGDEGDMMSMLLPLLMSGGLNGGDGLSSLMSGLSGLSGLSGFNTAGSDNKNSEKERENGDNDFSDEIDSLFKDFIDETRNDNYDE